MSHVEIIDDLYGCFPSVFMWDKKFLASRKLLDSDAFRGLCLVGLSGFFKSLSEVSYAVDKKTLSLQLYREILCYCAKELIDEYFDESNPLCPGDYEEVMEKGIDFVTKSNEGEVREEDKNYILFKLLSISKDHESLINIVNDSFVPRIFEEGKKDRSRIVLPLCFPPLRTISEEEEKGWRVVGDGVGLMLCDKLKKD